MFQIRLNQGVSGDNQVTPPPPDLIPPLNIIAPWCFKASNGYLLYCLITANPCDLSYIQTIDKRDPKTKVLVFVLKTEKVGKLHLRFIQFNTM